MKKNNCILSIQLQRIKYRVGWISLLTKIIVFPQISAKYSLFPEHLKMHKNETDNKNRYVKLQSESSETIANIRTV